MLSQETLNTLILERIWQYCPAELMQIYRTAGNATAAMENLPDIAGAIFGGRNAAVPKMKDPDEARRKAESEMEFAARNGINILCIADSRYPQRMKTCPDAPLALFFRGNADLNCRRAVCIVGTRHCTPYGQDLTQAFVKDLSRQCPETLIVSGLAYGIDINAHRAALGSGMNTVAVLAHGLDYLYPPRHRETAERMTTQGGLITEFFTGSNADKINFIRRNRIIAGIADATVIVESASHGGGLVTTRIATEYGREVFAFPGRTGDRYSEGCNNLIRDNKAALISNAADFVNAMGWQDDALIIQARQQGIERTLFPTLSQDEQTIVSALQKENDRHINTLASATGMPISSITALLFSLEMKGVIRCMAGGVYHLIQGS